MALMIPPCRLLGWRRPDRESRAAQEPGADGGRNVTRFLEKNLDQPHRSRLQGGLLQYVIDVRIVGRRGLDVDVTQQPLRHRSRLILPVFVPSPIHEPCKVAEMRADTWLIFLRPHTATAHSYHPRSPPRPIVPRRRGCASGARSGACDSHREGT